MWSLNKFCCILFRMLVVELLSELMGDQTDWSIEETTHSNFFLYDEWRVCSYYIFNIIMFFKVFFRGHNHNWEVFLEIFIIVIYFFFLLISELLSVSTLCGYRDHIDCLIILLFHNVTSISFKWNLVPTSILAQVRF